MVQLKGIDGGTGGQGRIKEIKERDIPAITVGLDKALMVIDCSEIRRWSRRYPVHLTDGSELDFVRTSRGSVEV